MKHTNEDISPSPRQDNSDVDMRQQEDASVVVIIPYYNGSKFITRALKSVFSQLKKANEVIVVNDGSSAEESEFLHTLKDQFSIKIIDQENGGQGSARNTGVSNSRSDYICFLDQDDFFLDHHIETLVHYIPKADDLFGYCYGDLLQANESGKIISHNFIRNKSIHPKEDIFNQLRYDMFVLPSASIISRKAFNAVGGFDKRLKGYEDDDLFLRIFRAGFSNKFIPDCVTVWCIHLNSTSYSVKMSRSRFIYFNKLCNNFPDNHHLNNFIFRDAFLPRFGPLFIKDAIRHKITKSQEYDEILGFLHSFHNKVKSNKTISSYVRTKYFTATVCLKLFPRSFFLLIRFIYRLIHKIHTQTSQIFKPKPILLD